MEEDYSVISCVEEAIDRTIEILWPIDRLIWFRLFIIVLFIGGSLLTSWYAEMFNQEDIFLMIINPDIIASHIPAFELIGVVLVIIVLILLYMKAIFSYVFIEVLKNRNNSIKKLFPVQIKRGTQYFVSFFLIMVAATAIIMTLAILFLIPELIENNGQLIPLMDAFIIYFVLSMVFLFPIWILLICMYDFVVPLMLFNDIPIYAAWKMTFSLFMQNVRIFVSYLITRVILTLISIGIMGIIDLYLGILLHLVSVSIPGESGVWILCSMCVIITISLFILTPITTFFRFFSLIFLSHLYPGITITHIYQNVTKNTS